MKIYATDKIRNVVMLGHGGCGKTTLVESMAYLSGITNRPGKIEDGNTISDYDKEEIKRRFSINTSLVPIEWSGHKINVLDTPGYFDFVGEVEEACSVADAAIIVISGKSGIETGTKRAWEMCDRFNLPRMIFVTDLDDDNASYREIVEGLNALYGKCITPLFFPIRENGKFVGYVNVVKEGGRRWLDRGERQECEIPEYSLEYLEKYKEILFESVAETSEEFMDRYFDGDTFTYEEICASLRANVSNGLVPVAMGSGLNLQGTYNLLEDIIQYFPSPNKKEVVGTNQNSNEVFQANYDFSKAKTAFVFKTVVDPFIGKYSLIKMYSGVLKPGDTLYNAKYDVEDKISKVYVFQGNTPIEVSELHAGDIGALAKLSKAATGDTLSTKATPVLYAKTSYSQPYEAKRYTAKNKNDEDKMSNALDKLLQEDLTLKLFNDTANRQTLIYGIGNQHLEVAMSKLKERYGVELILSEPKIAFKETIIGNSDVEYKYKKQSGGHGQYGHVKMQFSPSYDMETPFVFEQVVVGGAVPKNYFPAVEKGLQESVLVGPLAGYPVVGVKAVLYDGSYHPVDSSEMAFKTASAQAFKKGFMEAKPVLLEPIVSMEVIIPDDYTGDIMGDLNKRRGRVLGLNPTGEGKTVIEAEVPLASLYGYSTDLRSMTGGAGDYSYELARYEQAPNDIQEREMKAFQEKE